MSYIKDKDLNLLGIFAALWQHRNVTKAANHLGVTQPALSRALRRLRHEFNDPLFVRAARGITPTERACEIAPLVTQTLDALANAYKTSSVFDPKDCKKIFTIVTTDYFEMIAAAKLIPRLEQEAPNVTLRFRTRQGSIPKEELERGEVDLVIHGIYETLPESFYCQKILTDSYRTILRRNHPCKKLTLDQFTKLQHILVTPRGDLHGVVDQALEKIQRTRKIAVAVPSFMSAGWTVAHTDYTCSAPGLLIDAMKEHFPLQDFPTPVSVPELNLFQIWHARTGQDPAHKWLRQLIHTTCKK